MFDTKIPGTPRITKNSVRPRIKYLSARKVYKMYLPKLPVGVEENVYYFNEDEIITAIPKNVRRTWFIGKTTLKLAKQYPNTYLALNMKGEIFKKRMEEYSWNSRIAASKKDKEKFVRYYIKYCNYKNIPYNRNTIDEAYEKYKKKYAEQK